MRLVTCMFFVFVFMRLSFGQSTREGRLQLFDLNSVRLLDGPFKHAQDLNKKYILELDADRLLAPYLREANLQPRKPNYTNWENTGLDGHIGGHYVSALSLLYAATGDTEVYERLDYVLKELKRCQDNLNTGYIGGVPGSQLLWQDVKNGKIKAGNFDLNGKWVPLYNIHKIYAGLRDAYLLAHREDAKDMLIKLTEWSIDLVNNLSEDQIQDMLRSEHGGLNEIFADVAVVTSNPKYLQLAEKFTDRRILNPLLNYEDNLTGLHANTQIPKIIGIKRIADLEGKQDWDQAARFFWETVVDNRSVAIGGNSASEHFHPSDNFSNMMNNIEGPETCNTYNMLKLSSQFYQSEGAMRYIDYYEQALYNHILSSQHPVHGGLVYFTPMKPNHYRVYSQPQTSFWCCVGSGIENHSKYGEMIYAHKGNDLYVNLFIASELDWAEKGIILRQETSFPNEGKIKFIFSPKSKTKIDLKIRYPSWIVGQSLRVLVNGKSYKVHEIAGDYISIDRVWKKGDTVELLFNMDIEVKQLPDKSDFFAYKYGPLVLASKTNSNDLKGILADDSRGGHIAHGASYPIQSTPHLTGDISELKDKLELISAKELRFKLHNSADEYDLIPFYQLHDSRYIIYWPRENRNEDLAFLAREDSLLKMQQRTVDLVKCGQQQSESDHGISYDDSIIGSDNGIQWRRALGWFSYSLRDDTNEGSSLLISVADKDDSIAFDVLVNNSLLIGDQLPTGNVLYQLPRQEKEYQIVIKSKDGKPTPKIQEVRLMNDKM